MSVSTLMNAKGAAAEVIVVNFSMKISLAFVSSFVLLPDLHQELGRVEPDFHVCGCGGLN